MATINSILTNQFFLMFLAIATGLVLGKVKIKSFSLGVSGVIFTGIIIGYLVTKWAHGAQAGAVGFANAKRIISTGVVAQAFFTFFLLLFLVSIGLKVGNAMGSIFKRYGIKFVIIGVSVPVVSMLVSCVIYLTVLSSNPAITPFETIGMFAGAMTSTPGYGTALDAAEGVDYQALYEEADDEEKDEILSKISTELTVADTPSLSDDQIASYKKYAATAISLGYTVAFPIGVFVIVILISVIPKMLRIDMEEEKRRYHVELSQSQVKATPEAPVNFMTISLAACIGIIVGNITIPLGGFGSFSLGAVGGVLLMALILSYIGKIGPVNFRMNSKDLGTLYNMGLTFFMAVVGLRYGYDVISSLTGSGLVIAISAVFIEGIATLVAVFIGRKVFKMNWLILSGAIAGGCTSAPGLGAAISSTGSDEPTAGYGASQPFAILANVLLATIFFNVML